MIYSDEIKKHFFEPENVLYEDESLFSHNARGVGGDEVCGGQMLMLLQIKDDKIKDIRWKTYGCASAIASTSILSTVIKGMNMKDAFNISPDIIANKFGKIPNNKLFCSVVGNEALQNAINNYLEQSGREKFETTKKKTLKKCSSKPQINDKNMI